MTTPPEVPSSTMVQTGDDSPQSNGFDESTVLLRRILRAVEKDERSRWFEITCAIVLSLATTASAWCAYEATLWSGVQTFRLAAANKASRASSANSLLAMQIRTFEGSLLISAFEARQRGDEGMETFFLQRLRSDSRAVFSEWEKLDPANNPEAPRNPFLMPGYQQPELIEAQQLDELSEQEHAAAFHANKTSDGYVLLTVLFASVLFFGGVSGTFDTHRLRVSALGISIVLLTLTLFALATMPICRD